MGILADQDSKGQHLKQDRRTLPASYYDMVRRQHHSCSVPTKNACPESSPEDTKANTK